MNTGLSGKCINLEIISINQRDLQFIEEYFSHPIVKITYIPCFLSNGDVITQVSITFK